MQLKVIYKWLSTFGVAFFLISTVELIFALIFNLSITINLNGDNISIGDVIFTSGFMPIHSRLIEIIILSTIVIFITLGLVLIIISKKKAFQELMLAKYLLLIGLFLILGGFFKLAFLVFLGKTDISTGLITAKFQDAVYNHSITPLFGAVIWMYFIGVVCSFLISGLIFGAIGLKWILNLQEKTK